MALLYHCFLLVSFLFLFISSAVAAAASFHEKAIVIPVSKDKWSQQHTLQINQRTPSVPVKLTVDLNSRLTWVDCEEGYVSSSYRPAICGSSDLCSRADTYYYCPNCDSQKPGCYSTACKTLIYNVVAGGNEWGEIGEDVVSIQSFNHAGRGRNISLPNFPFICSTTSMLSNFADGVTGIAALGYNNLSFPYYISDAVGLPKRFDLCLSSSPKDNGFVSFGGALQTPNDLLVSYTPLILKPRAYSADFDSANYYIGVKSIRVGGKKIKFDKTLLSITKEHFGAIMLSTATPYTILDTPIYKALVESVRNLTGLSGLSTPWVPAPFEACFYAYSPKSREELMSGMPIIDLELKSDKGKTVYWRIMAANSLVQVDANRMCLAFIDGKGSRGFPIIIGGHQLEENLVNFDLANLRLGFSSHLYTKNTSCSNLISSTL